MAHRICSPHIDNQECANPLIPPIEADIPEPEFDWNCPDYEIPFSSVTCPCTPIAATATIDRLPCGSDPYITVFTDCNLVDSCPTYDLTLELGLPSECLMSGSLGLEVLGEDDTYTPVDVFPTDAIEFDHFSGFIVTQAAPGFVIVTMWPASCTQDGIVTHGGTQYFGGTKCFDLIELGTNCSLDPCAARLYNSGCGPNEHTDTGGANVILDGSPTLNGFQVQSDIYCPNIWVSDICNAVSIQGNTVTATEYFVGATIGWSGTFATGDARTVTVQFGLITNVA